MSEKLINLYHKYMNEYKDTGKNKGLYLRYYRKLKKSNTLIPEKNTELKKSVFIKNNIIDILNKYMKYNNLIQNNYIKEIKTNINLKNDSFYFGIVVPVYNRFHIFNLFLNSLKYNINFKSILFCFVDDGSDDNRVRNELKNLPFSYISIFMKRDKNNIYSGKNTKIPGGYFPLTLFIGLYLIKNNSSIIGILESDTYIKKNFFQDIFNSTHSINMDYNMISGFNSCQKERIIKEKRIGDKTILYHKMVGNVSLFFSKKIWNMIQDCFTGVLHEDNSAYQCDWDMCKILLKNNINIISNEISKIQHIGIRTTMIRLGKIEDYNNETLKQEIYNVLKNPKKYKNSTYIIDYNTEFDKNELFFN